MLPILNENYYIDLEEINSLINIEPTESISGETGQHISVVQYELIKIMIEVIMSEQDEVDEKLGAKSQLSIPFKLAFNTLLNNKTIKKY
jgi:hypothetical protein